MFQKLGTIVNKIVDSIKAQPRTHDYTDGNRGWGHDYGIQPKKNTTDLDAYGWGYDIKKGDYILLQNGNDTTRYQFKSIRYCDDPSDMWFAVLAFAPRIRSTLDVEEEDNDETY